MVANPKKQVFFNAVAAVANPACCGLYAFDTVQYVCIAQRGK